MTNQTEPAGVARLRAAREAAAALESQHEANTVRTVKPGDIVHAVSTGLTISRSSSLWGGAPPLNLTRGDRIVVTEEMIAADIDRNGNRSWTAMVADPDAQLRRWGRVHLAPGEPPADMHPWTYGDPAWSEAREQARRAAWAQPTAEARADALRKVNEVYGPAATTSTVTATYRGDAAHEAQQQAIAASAANGTPNLAGGTS